MIKNECLLETRNITKRFPGVLANNNICLKINKGEIHALLGENGAGKSTLMNVLYGLYQPQSGQIILDGCEVCIESPKHALEMGIGMIHQNFMLIPNLTVLENVVLGLPSKRPPLLQLEQVRAQVKALFEKYNFVIRLDDKIGDLSVGEQQRVEIIKALYRNTKLLILDEPTAVLTPQETVELFRVLKELKTNGNSIIFISHKIEEVLEISDQITILRDGEVIDTFPTENATREILAKMMVGREISLKVDKPANEPGEVRLEICNVSMKDAYGRQVLNDVCLSVRSGEIVGIAGVDGNGQDELAFALSGLSKIASGSIKMNGMDVCGLKTQQILEKEFAHIPANRTRNGMVKEFTISENLIFHIHSKRVFNRFGFLQLKAIDQYSKEKIKDFDIRTPGPAVLADHLSGGNQQKVVIAREFSRSPRILLVVQPTRGLDIGAKEFVHKEILRQRQQGAAILVISTDLEEARALSDRLAVMYKGSIVGVVDPETTAVDEIGLMMAGINKSSKGGDE